VPLESTSEVIIPRISLPLLSKTTAAVLAVTLADWHKPAEAHAVYAEMFARARRQYLPPAVLAVAAFAAGKKREALRHAREALEIRDPNCQVFFTGHNAYGVQLCAYPRFRELLTEFGFK
jgi:Tfp pilus assembly protein PilF